MRCLWALGDPKIWGPWAATSLASLAMISVEIIFTADVELNQLILYEVNEQEGSERLTVITILDQA